MPTARTGQVRIGSLKRIEQIYLIWIIMSTRKAKNQIPICTQGEHTTARPIDPIERLIVRRALHRISTSHHTRTVTFPCIPLANAEGTHVASQFIHVQSLCPTGPSRVPARASPIIDRSSTTARAPDFHSQTASTIFSLRQISVPPVVASQASQTTLVVVSDSPFLEFSLEKLSLL